MRISQADGVLLIANLWMGRYPLVRKYFGRYLGQLLKALQDDPFDELFTVYAFHPQGLERRLEILGALDPPVHIDSLVSEIGHIQDPRELDGRLVNLLAELRLIGQIALEGFSDIQKVTEVADIVAEREGTGYAFQVTRISTTLKDKARSASPYGNIFEIHQKLEGPSYRYLWDAVQRKNDRYASWKGHEVRCIVIVTNDEYLQDPLVRHIACQQLQCCIRDVPTRHFEELVWLPDMGNGAWFKVGASPDDIHCFADWKDAPEDWGREAVKRREVDLECPINAYKVSSSTAPD